MGNVTLYETKPFFSLDYNFMVAPKLILFKPQKENLHHGLHSHLCVCTISRSHFCVSTKRHKESESTRQRQQTWEENKTVLQQEGFLK